MKKLILLALVATTLFGCKQGPTTEQYKDLYKTFATYSAMADKKEFTAEKEAELNTDLQKQDSLYDLSKAYYRQMINLMRAARVDVAYKWMLPALQAKAAEKCDSASTLDYMIFSREGKDAKLTYERFMKIMAYPTTLLADQNTCHSLKLFSRVEMTDAQFIDFVKLLNANVNGTTHIYAFYQLTNDVWKKILGMGENFPKELKEEYYQKMLEAMRTAIAESKDPNINSLKSTYESFNTLFARGELIGSTAPEIDFLWNSAGMDLKNLADLRGKVVIVDFWATWCGPCVQSFPNVRKLQERYKDYDVIILGVPSIQGRHIDRVNKKTINTKDDPEKEFNLMKTFMSQQNMTWKVAFAKQEVYNPDYGVFGVPHIAIIDVNGKVRYNELNPHSDPYEEAEKIDALLKEAGLKYPTEPMEKRNWAKEEMEKAAKKNKKR